MASKIMTTTTRWRGWGPPPRPAPDRRLSFDGERRRLKVTEFGVTTTFAVDDVSAGGTRAYRLVALDDDVCGEVVVVLDGRHSECDCLEGQRHGHRQLCVHAAALWALERAGRL